MNTEAMQAPALVQRLVQAHGAQWVGLDDAEAFTAGPGARVLFFCGDPVRFPEGLDVAVVLPELHAALGRLQRGEIKKSSGKHRWQSGAMACRSAVGRPPGAGLAVFV